MLSQLRPVVTLIAIFTLLTGVILPWGFTGLGALAFPYQAQGSLIVRDGKVVGSSIIGQNFASDRYFQGRPSALMGTDPKDSSKQVATPYDASESGASNLGPTSKALVDRVTADIAKAGVKPADIANSGAKPVPADALTTSASGLDPDITPVNASRQVARVAAARKLPAETVQKLVEQNTAEPVLGFLGEPRVNVLNLNLVLDRMSAIARAGTASRTDVDRPKS